MHYNWLEDEKEKKKSQDLRNDFPNYSILLPATKYTYLHIINFSQTPKLYD